ncbi:MFS transporter [Saccharopolyspora spinosporotrichia]|uniref:MFS transporter n=1 Tax=Saccharopolyspora erythraea TaxID=1836 RepID=UPI0001D313F1|nr:MFS transporter [Saccharopolyspora erythraea]
MVSVVSVLIGIYLLDRVGRQPVIITGQAGITISLALLGGCFLLPESTVRSYVVLGFMLVFLFFMQSVISTVYWLVMAEVFPSACAVSRWAWRSSRSGSATPPWRSPSPSSSKSKSSRVTIAQGCPFLLSRR